MPPKPGTEAWYAQVTEEIIEPERRIIDPHHHLWFGGGFHDYLLADLWKDTSAGHRVEKTVFIECGVAYRDLDPEFEHLNPVGETEFAAGVAAESAAAAGSRAVIAGIVAFIDLTRPDILAEMLALHETTSHGLLRGIRYPGAHHPNPEEGMFPGQYGAGLFRDATFQAGVRFLGQCGYTYESWHYHTQNRDYLALAQAAPDTIIILDHFGTPLGTGSFQNQRAEIFRQWQQDIRDLAACPNVYAKLGGLAQPDNGFGWHTAARPPTSDEIVAAHKPFYDHTIACFGPERCMFESNFPVDGVSVSYPVLWNAFKKMAAGFSEAEKHMLFYGTAEKVYNLY